MCGIAGIVSPDTKEKISPELIDAMTQSLVHRGPDGDGFWAGDGVAFGHRRLVTIDHEGGHQPMIDPETNVVLTFNGFIYNFKELRRQLEKLGHKFRSRSDTEVLLASYMEWGHRCVDHLRGMFAFAIWDSRRRQLFAARDRLGIKPFHWAMDSEGCFVFASELKAILLMPKVRQRLRVDAVDDFLALGYVPDPKTIFSDVNKLAPGHFLVLNQGSVKPQMTQYWSPTFAPSLSKLEAEEQFYDRFEAVVKMRMTADVPVGAFLSGGLDSSAVVALMTKFSEENIETCSIGNEDPVLDESNYASLIAERFGTNHRLRFASEEDGILLEFIPGLFDEPFADISAMPTFQVCGLARERVTIALSGDGADELFGGYRRHKYHMIEEQFRKLLPLSVRSKLFGTMANIYPKFDQLPSFLRAKTTFEGLSKSWAGAYFNSVAKVPDRDRLPLQGARLKSALDGYRPSELFENLAADVDHLHPLSQIQYLDLMTYLPGDILTKVDRTSMAHSLEVRVPFLDHKFVEYALMIDPTSHILEGEGKSVMRRSLQGILPSETTQRKKQGFDVPIRHWLYGSLKEKTLALGNSERLFDLGLIDRKGLENKILRHMDFSQNNEASIWSLLVLDKCLAKYNLEGSV